MKFLWIGAGGALGSMARFALETWIQRAHGAKFPFGILAVNALGSFAIGVVLLGPLGKSSEHLRLFLAVGGLGGFTTYSSYNFQVIELARGGEWGRAALYVVSTLGLCLLAGLGGGWIGRALSV
jgi:CrcB protein